MARDITEAQFLDALRRHGLTRGPMFSLMGYVCMPDGTNVSGWIHGDKTTRRVQLAHLLSELEKNPYERYVRERHLQACRHAIGQGRPFSFGPMSMWDVPR